MKYEWIDLPKPLNCFTTRNATMKNLNNNKIIQYYSANTKIVVVQKCVTPTGTFYRTDPARHHYLNYAFEATALGLPNEFAPPAPSYSSKKALSLSAASSPRPPRKQKVVQKGTEPKGGEAIPKKSWFKRLFRKDK